MKRLLLTLALIIGLFSFPASAIPPSGGGTGTGDMTKAVYDADDNNKIDASKIDDISGTYQTKLTYPVTGVASPTAGNLVKWGASGNTLADSLKIGTFTDAKWCSYSTAGGLACTEDSPAGSGDITSVLDTASGAVPYLVQAWTAFGAADATPDVSTKQNWKTADTTTVTGFDHGGSAIPDGRIINVYCAGAAVFDLTSSEITAANRATDYTCTAGMVLTFMYQTDQWYALNIPDPADTLTFTANGHVGYNYSGSAFATIYPDASTVEIYDDAGQLKYRVKDDGIAVAKMANGDWGDFAISSNVATIDNDAVTAAKIADWYEYATIPIAWCADGSSPPDALDDRTTRPPYQYRTFSTSADEDVNCVWFVPSDLSGSTVQYRVKYLVTNATGPSASEGVAFGLSGVSIGDNDATNAAKGTVVVVTDDELNAAQWDVLITGWSGDVTITNLAAGEVAELALIRDVSDAVDDYGQVVGVLAIEIRYVKNVAR